MKPKRKEGWQFGVDIYDDHVIKTPKTRKEIKCKVKRYLRFIGKIHETEERIEKILKAIPHSIRIIKKSKMPLKYFAYPEFLKDGKIKQKRAISIEDKLKELIKKKKISQAEDIIKKFIKFQYKMWEYGIHEEPIKFNRNFGLINNKIVLIDFFELTSNKEKVKKRLRKKPWRKNKWYYLSLPGHIVDYYIEQADKELTVKNLDKYWKKKLK